MVAYTSAYSFTFKDLAAFSSVDATLATFTSLAWKNKKGKFVNSDFEEVIYIVHGWYCRLNIQIS